MLQSKIENGNTQPTVFSYGEHSKLRTFTIDSIPWFVAQDACTVLGITNGKDVVRRQLDDDEKTKRLIVAPSDGKRRSTWLINESGLYNLIFRSNKPEAKQFRKWVTSEVLPSLRKHGTYTTPTAEDADIPHLVNMAIEEVGSQRILSYRIGCAAATINFAKNGRLEALSPEMKNKIRAVCALILNGHHAPDITMIELILQVEDKDVRMKLYSRFKKGGKI